MATIRTNDGEFTGRTPESIVRRVYGRTATIQWSADPNSPDAGEVLGPKARALDAHEWPVLARLVWVEP